jgi:hypothetical protein
MLQKQGFRPWSRNSLMDNCFQEIIYLPYRNKYNKFASVEEVADIYPRTYRLFGIFLVILLKQGVIPSLIGTLPDTPNFESPQGNFYLTARCQSSNFFEDPELAFTKYTFVKTLLIPRLVS